MAPCNSSQTKRGFTLIEVLIALVIIAIALMAVMRSITESIRVASHVKTKMAAHWAAMNALSEIQIGMIRTPTQGDPVSGTTHFFGQVYTWQARDLSNEASAYANPIIIRVSQDKKIIETMTAYVKPLENTA